jgi:hypothetical protein
VNTRGRSLTVPLGRRPASIRAVGYEQIPANREKPSDGLEPSTPSLPSRFCGNWSQPVATVLACFRRFRGLPICHRLPLVAPARLHKRSILSAPIRDEKTDCEHSGPPTEPRDHFPCREVVIGSTRGVVLILRFDGRSRRSRRDSRARCSRSTNAREASGERTLAQTRPTSLVESGRRVSGADRYRVRAVTETNPICAPVSPSSRSSTAASPSPLTP